ncbi:family 20 glycosylhydrolase [Neisseria sp.]|uniref:family 20 glycosylhydrolase n=1 Tax=Neisseria sp. TaxID=192066 RepID=UPI0035A0ACF3
MDIARNYYTVKEIKQYIDTISTNIGKNNGGFLHLHISDNENYGVESKVLGQTVGSANVSYNSAVSEEERVYTYDHNGAAAGGETKFLSTEQLKIIVGYAREKGVEIVPEIDSQGHAKGIYNLLAEQGKSVENIFVGGDTEIDITKPDAVSFMQSLYDEVIAVTKPVSQHFHIGGDEFYSNPDNGAFISYVNTMQAYLEEKGLITRIETFAKKPKLL